VNPAQEEAEHPHEREHAQGVHLHDDRLAPHEAVEPDQQGRHEAADQTQRVLPPPLEPLEPTDRVAEDHIVGEPRNGVGGKAERPARIVDGGIPHHLVPEPALPRGGYEEVSDTESRSGLSDTAADWVRYRNSYRNTLLWSVGEFFSRLFASGRLDNALILYTSDHGQDLHERGNPGLNTHCGQTPVMEEGLVPLVVLHGASLRTVDWGAHLAENRNRSSHFNIFPTLLQLMGYELDQVRATYGQPLTVPTNDPFTFNIRFNARLGSPPKWAYIDLRQIVMPPADGASIDGEGTPNDRPAQRTRQKGSPERPIVDARSLP